MAAEINQGDDAGARRPELAGAMIGGAGPALAGEGARTAARATPAAAQSSGWLIEPVRN